MKRENSSELRIAFAGHWKSTHPGLQHTLIGDLTLSNQFEALVGFNENGVYVPLAAKQWSISSDYRIFRFEIDTNKRFSDGVSLSAHHFKESWETSLRIQPLSANSSLLDVLYKVEGFPDFKRDGVLSGVRVIDNATLEIRFSSPFRMALEHLSGNRFSAYRLVDGSYLGTGAYVIKEIGPDDLLLTPNPYFLNASRRAIHLKAMKMADCLKSLEDGSLDVIAFTMGSTLPREFAENTKYSLLIGQDALHRSLYTNNQRNRLFENRKYRRALQYLVFEYLKKNPDALGNRAYTSLDPQVYLPIQAGRLSESEVEEIIRQGKPYVDDFLSATRKNPLIVIETSESPLRPMLSTIGISISPKSRFADKSAIIDIIYEGEEPDILFGSFGVASGDPDGIYHKLGKSGAIASPMTQSDLVAQMLEHGRRITEKEQIDPFYKTVSRAILSEVPIVHLGFSKAVAIYRNDKVRVQEKILRRNEGHLHVFEAN
ncbi:MAG: ABC transporter substrate-binding protein [Bdellovibrionales bacterium]